MTPATEPTYETKNLGDEQVDAIAFDIAKRFHGFPMAVARRVLRRTEFWLDATQEVDCGSSEFQRADAALRAASPESA